MGQRTARAAARQRRLEPRTPNRRHDQARRGRADHTDRRADHLRARNLRALPPADKARGSRARDRDDVKRNRRRVAEHRSGGETRGSGRRRVIEAEDPQPHDEADRHSRTHQDQPTEAHSSHSTLSIAPRLAPDKREPTVLAKDRPVGHNAGMPPTLSRSACEPSVRTKTKRQRDEPPSDFDAISSRWIAPPAILPKPSRRTFGVSPTGEPGPALPLFLWNEPKGKPAPAAEPPSDRSTCLAAAPRRAGFGLPRVARSDSAGSRRPTGRRRDDVGVQARRGGGVQGVPGASQSPSFYLSRMGWAWLTMIMLFALGMVFCLLVSPRVRPPVVRRDDCATRSGAASLGATPWRLQRVDVAGRATALLRARLGSYRRVPGPYRSLKPSRARQRPAA